MSTGQKFNKPAGAAPVSVRRTPNEKPLRKGEREGVGLGRDDGRHVDAHWFEFFVAETRRPGSRIG